MSQTDVYELLLNKRLRGDNSYYSVNEIFEELKIMGLCNHKISTFQQLNKLTSTDFLDVKLEKYLRRIFRLKKKYVTKI